MIEIEPSSSDRSGRCPDCNRLTRIVRGFVRIDGSARAVYVIRWTDGHRERGAQLIVGIGEWGTNSAPDKRNAIGFECRMGVDRPGFMVVDAANMDWVQSAILGRKLSRAEALKHPVCQEAFSIVDRVVEDDSRFKDFLIGKDVIEQPIH